MDDADVGIDIDGHPRVENGPIHLHEIPATYDPDRPVTYESPMITVKFDETVELTFIDLSQPSGSTSWDDVSVIIRRNDLDSFYDDASNPVATEVIPVVNGRIDLPDDFPYTDEITIIFVSSTNSSLIVTIDFLGCVHPGMYHRPQCNTLYSFNTNG